MDNEFFAPGVIDSNLPAEQVSKKSASTEIIYCSTEQARDKVSFEIAYRNEILPLQIFTIGESQVLSCAVIKNDPEIKKNLEFQLGLKVELIECYGQDLNRAIYIAYKKNDSNLNRLKDKIRKSSSSLKEIKNYTLAAGNSDEMKFLQALVEYAVASGASDIHLIPTEQGTLLKLRINGSLIEHPEAVGEYSRHELFVNRLKVLARLDISVKSLPQDGNISLSAMGKNLFIRVSTMPTIAGEKVVLRIQGSSELLKLNSLGLEAKTEKFLRQALNLNEGLIIFCGPTGSGKTTTIYAALDELSRKSLSIVTIEDPVEINFARAEQTDLSILKNLTYEKALRSVLRQDPDVIVVGEIREAASAELAFNAALTGHLVLTTVHAGSVAGVLLRLKQLGIAEHLASSCIKLIISQRLIPQLCPRCAVSDLENSVKTEEKVKKAVGCQYCSGSGYSAQIPVTEAGLMSPEIINNYYETTELGKKSSNYKSALSELKNLLKRGKIDYPTFSYYSSE
jgi:type II secretory ATPase GspE/PulE/Tfp pilus assembly ATPase PilB-like protein